MKYFIFDLAIFFLLSLWCSQLQAVSSPKVTTSRPLSASSPIVFSPSKLTNSSTSCNNNTNCVDRCDIIDYNTVTVTSLVQSSHGFEQFRNSVAIALAIMKSYPGVVTDDRVLLHMTLQYFCCYNPVQYEEIIYELKRFQWHPMDLRFNTTVCNVGGDGDSNYTSIIVLLDDEGQQILGEFVASIEAHLISKNIPVHRPRSQMEPFHSTLGVVKPGYPVEEIVQRINTELPIFNSDPITLKAFFMSFPFAMFNASSPAPSAALDAL
jgi:hypothetical protein